MGIEPQGSTEPKRNATAPRMGLAPKAPPRAQTRLCKLQPQRHPAPRGDSHGGEARGKVVRKQTSRTTIKGYVVDASPEEPQFIVETHEGKRAAHKPGALRKG